MFSDAKSRRGWVAAFALIAGSLFCWQAAADVVVFHNATTRRVEFVLIRPDGSRLQYAIGPADVLPISEPGKAQIVLDGGNLSKPYLLAPNTVQYFVARGKQIELHTVDLREVSSTEEAKEPPSDPAATHPVGRPLKRVYTVPVMLLVDEEERRVPQLWEERLRERLSQASDIMFRYCRVRFEPVAVGTWASDDARHEFADLLWDFQQQVTPAPAKLALGFSSQIASPAERTSLGGTRGPFCSHILIRESSGRLSDREKLEVLLHELGHFLGAAHSPEHNSAMRATLGDGLAKARGFRIGFDALNTLVMYRVGEQLRGRGVSDFFSLQPPIKAQLRGVYRVMQEALPGDRTHKFYQALLDREARSSRKALAYSEPLMEGTRAVVSAVNEALIARSSTAAALPSGDRLTELCIRRAASKAATLPPETAASAFVLGIAIAIDDSATLYNSPLFRDFCRAVDPPQQRASRRDILRQATVHGSRDLAKQFVVSAALVELIGSQGAQSAGIRQEMKDAHGGKGLSFADLTIHTSGVAFAELVLDGRLSLAALADGFEVGQFVPPANGLPHPVSWDRFLAAYGSVQDERFHAVMRAMRQRIDALPGYTKEE